MPKQHCYFCNREIDILEHIGEPYFKCDCGMYYIAKTKDTWSVTGIMIDCII